MAVQALGRHYFDDNGFPVTVRQVSDNEHVHHKYDLTDKCHYHDFSELVLITSGQGTQVIDNDEYPVTAGDVFLLTGSKEHYFREHENLALYNVMFRDDRLLLPRDEMNRIPGYHALFVLEPQTRRRHGFEGRLHLGRVDLAHCEAIVQRMLSEWEERLPGWEVDLLALLLELIVFLSRAYTNTQTTTGRSLYRVGSVIGALESDHARQWRLSEMAQLANVSESHFLQVFREATGHSPIDYLLRLRIQKAMEMLRSTNSSVSEVAARVGFQDSNYFSRQFRRVMALSPREYRKRAR